MTEILSKELSRRSFLKGSGALVVGFSLAGVFAGKGAAATVPSSAGYNPPTNQVDSWLTVHSDNTVSFKSSQIEVGNGVTTGLAMLVAEELDLSLAQVRHGPWDSWQLVNSGSTGGSTGIESSAGPRLRAAATTARQKLLSLASTSLGVPVANLTVSDGVVSGGGRSTTYGALVGGQLLSATIPVATINPGAGGSKAPVQYKLIGTRQPRIGLPDKVTGKHTYVHNVKVPGMWHARVVRPRGQGAYGTGAKILSVDESSIKNVPARIVRKGEFLAVAAEHEYDAIQAAAQLKVTWQENATLPSSGNVFKQLRQHDSAGFAPARYRTNTGNVETALRSAAHSVSQTYQFHYGSRAVIGPSAAVADVRSDSASIFSSTQAIFTTVTEVARLLGMQPANVRTYFYEGSSSFGNAQSRTDVAKAAALVSQAIGKPVKMQFMRWDEHGWDNFQQAMIVDVRAGIDTGGKLVAYDYTLLSQPYSNIIDLTSELLGDPYPTSMTQSRIDDPSVGDAYTAPSMRLMGKTADVYKGYFRTSSHVSGGSGQQSAFATEQAIDELAYAAKMDPVEFRRRNISNDAWLMALDAAAKAAGWQPRVAASNLSSATVVTGRGVGIGSHGTAARSAAVVDIEVNKKTGKILVKHIYNGIDAGLAVNPEGIESQMTGLSVMGVSRALHEQVTFNTKRVTSLDWVTYPILRFAEAPKVTNLVPQRKDRLPTGVGEPPITPIPAAIANAFFDATGVRVRQAPMTPAVVRAALRAAGK